MVAVEFYEDIAKEFKLDPERLKMAKLSLYPGSTPLLELTIELNAQQAKALHWIKEK